MNIYDCFMYFDEDLLLDLRLNTLSKYVKKFVITEATYTHNGDKKKLLFDINNFKKFKDKIIYHIVDKQPSNILELKKHDTKERRGEKLILNGMARDYFQRENLSKGLIDAEDNDLILISDLDEIPNLNFLSFPEINNRIVIFKQKMFYYKLNLLYEDFTWLGTKGVKFKNFISPQWLRNIKGKKYPIWRVDTFFSKKKYSNLMFVENGGWHFTCIKKPKEIHQKLLTFAHHQDYEDSKIDLDELEKKVLQKKVLYDHDKDKKKQNKWSSDKILKKIDLKLLPEVIANSRIKYKDWID